MTTRHRGIGPRSAQRITVVAVTGALLLTGVALANTAGGSDTVSSVQAIRTERILETAVPTAGAVTSPTPHIGLLTPGQTARPLNPATPPQGSAPTPGRVTSAPKNAAPDRAGKPGRPKPVAEAPKDRDGDDDDGHETVKPPVRDEDEDDDSDSRTPEVNDDTSDESERKVRRQRE